MSFDFTRPSRPAALDETCAYQDFGLRASWGENVVAVALALLFVTTVAVLMGLA